VDDAPLEDFAVLERDTVGAAGEEAGSGEEQGLDRDHGGGGAAERARRGAEDRNARPRGNGGSPDRSLRLVVRLEQAAARKEQ